MLGRLLSSILTGGISEVVNAIRDIQYAKIKQSTETNEIVKELELERLENENQARMAAKEIRLATKDFWETRLAVALASVPTAFHYAAIVLDSTYHFGWNIAPLPEPFNEYEAIILLSPFGYGVLRSGISAFASTMLRKHR